MSDGTKIEWTDATANYVNGCSVVSPGCTNCYAMRLAGTRMRDHPTRKGLTIDTKAGPVWNGDVRQNEKVLEQVLSWSRPRLIFWNAHGDLFHESVPDEWIDRQFAVMALTPQHTHQVLTKRSDRMRAYLSDRDRSARLANVISEFAGWQSQGTPGPIFQLDGKVFDTRLPLPNVWLGVSVEDQARADERIPDLLETPAAVRWISAEPLLGPIDLLKEDGALWRCDVRIDWVVAGGESGPGARPMHPDWARQLRDQCASVQGKKAAFLFKQWGEWVPLGGSDGFWPHNEGGACRLMSDGSRHPRGLSMQRVGKARAGRTLDGVLHDGYPA